MSISFIMLATVTRFFRTIQSLIVYKQTENLATVSYFLCCPPLRLRSSFGISSAHDQGKEEMSRYSALLLCLFDCHHFMRRSGDYGFKNIP